MKARKIVAVLALVAVGCAGTVDPGAGAAPCDRAAAVQRFREHQGQPPGACGVWAVDAACTVTQLDPPMVEGRYDGGCSVEGQHIVDESNTLEGEDTNG